MGSLAVFIFFSCSCLCKARRIHQRRIGWNHSVMGVGGLYLAWFAFEGWTTGTLQREHASCYHGLRDLSIRGETQSRQEHMTSICILRNGEGGEKKKTADANTHAHELIRQLWSRGRSSMGSRGEHPRRDGLGTENGWVVPGREGKNQGAGC